MLPRGLTVLAGALIASLFGNVAAVSSASADTLEKIRDSGRILLGYREASYPFSFKDEAGKPAGYSMALCDRIVEAVRQELGLEDLAVNYVLVTPETRIPRLLDGQIDIECGSTTNTLSRQKDVDFTHLTFITGAKLLVKANRGIHDFGGLQDKTLAMTAGTTTEAGVKSVLARTGIAAETLIVEDHAAGFAALTSDKVDAYISDHVLLHGLRLRADDPDGYLVVGEFLSYEPYALMLRRNDADFRLIANRTLSEIFRDGEIDALYKEWFGPMGLVPSDLLKAAVRLQALPR